MKTDLQDAWSEDIHYKVMQGSKNRHKTRYLRHCQTNASDCSVHTDNVDDNVISLLVSESNQTPVKKNVWSLDIFFTRFETQFFTLSPCTVWAEVAATWSTPPVIFRRTTTGRRRATRHAGWAWYWRQDHSTSRLLSLEMWTSVSICRYCLMWYFDEESGRGSWWTEQLCLSGNKLFWLCSDAAGFEAAELPSCTSQPQSGVMVLLQECDH